MALQKQNININFGQGVDTKTDPFQVRPGKFASLQNSIFTKGGLLAKRNGYNPLTALPDNSATLATTFNGDLTAIGNNLQAYSQSTMTWVNRGTVNPVGLSTLPLIRNNTNQKQADSMIAPNGLICTVYTDQDPSNLSNAIYKYAVADSVTGQNVIAPTQLVTADATFGTPRVFLLSTYFVIVFTNKTGGNYHLQYVAIGVLSLAVTAPVDISISVSPSSTVSFDAAVLSNSLFIAWNGAAASGIKMATLSANLNLSATTIVDGAHVATIMSLCADSVNAVVWISYFDSGSSKGYSLAVNSQGVVVLAATQTIPSGTILNLATSAISGILTILYEVSNAYAYDGAIPTNFIRSNTLTQAGSLGTAVTVMRSVGLASKAFRIAGKIYFLCAYSSPFQPTYFLANLSGSVIAKVAWTNGGGYLPNGLPAVTVTGNVAQVIYLIKDSIQSVNKNTNVPSGTQIAGIYAQTGVNLVTFTIGVKVLTSELGHNLNLSGGFLWAYDGYSPVEQNFFLYPDSVEVTTNAAGGNIADQVYFYQFTYEWSDNQGNLFRSAPSIPVKITTAGGGTSTNTLHVPTLRLTYKTANPVKIVGYRWSAAQQTYYQFTSILLPTLNDLTTDQVTITDTLSDAFILGNNILYTNGGVVEDAGPPACSSTFIFDNRLWLIDSEDPNLLWFSKQVLDATPVEFSDLFTFFVSPSTGAQGSSGPLTCGFPMDDKAILFKDSSMLYINGTGPDITGANNQYSQPILITSTVGCSNQNSIVFMPTGLMFEFKSQAGNQIWLLGRDLSTRYIGAEVEAFTKNSKVQSAVNIPGTNQVRFTMSSGITLMYDYFYNQWGTFVNIPAISSTLYQGLHTYINSFGQVFQETPGLYIDNSSPVLMSFTTSWLNLAGLQGYQRAYYFFFLATYLSPHKLNVQIGYDYQPTPSQSFTIGPDNFAGVYGSDPLYGMQSPFGGPSPIEQWRNRFTQQKCQAFQITITETFDPAFNTAPGAGFTMSGLNVVFGSKKGWPRLPATRQIG